MPDDKIFKPLPQPQKKKKKKKKQKADITKDTDQSHPAASAPPVLPTIGPPRPPLPKLKSSKKNSEQSSRKSKKSPVSLLGLECKSGGSPVQNFLSQLSAQARESIRWEGALDDPLDEEQRLEMYRTNRRLRYTQHRETQLRDIEQENK